jgi:hypothetical protein
MRLTHQKPYQRMHGGATMVSGIAMTVLRNQMLPTYQYFWSGDLARF